MFRFIAKLFKHLRSAPETSSNERRVTPYGESLIHYAQGGDKDALEEISNFFFTQEEEEYFQPALYWNQKGANLGMSTAQARMAIIHHEGRGTPENPKKAFHYALKAAKQGHPGAQFLLGGFYDVGRGVERNQVEALFWFTLAKTDLPNDYSTIMYDKIMSEISDTQKQDYLQLIRTPRDFSQ